MLFNNVNGVVQCSEVSLMSMLRRDAKKSGMLVAKRGGSVFVTNSQGVITRVPSIKEGLEFLNGGTPFETLIAQWFGGLTVAQMAAECGVTA